MMDDIPFPKSAPLSLPEGFQGGFDEDAHASLEVSLMGDAPPDFMTANALQAASVPVGENDLLWNPGIEDEDWSIGQNRADERDIEGGFKEGNPGLEFDDKERGSVAQLRFQKEDGGGGHGETALTESVLDEQTDIVFDDSGTASDAEAVLERIEQKHDEGFYTVKDNEEGEEPEGLDQSAEQDLQSVIDKLAEGRPDILSSERGGTKADSTRDYELQEDLVDPTEPEQEWNLHAKQKIEALEPDYNADNVPVLEEELARSTGAQTSGDDGIVGVDKPAISEEEKTGVSDEGNTGTSEEEKLGLASIEKAGISVKASQKRKSSLSLASISGATNGHGGQVETVAKKAKKKPVNVWAKTSSRKGSKKNSSKNGAQQNLAKEDCVALIPVYRNQDRVDDGPDLPIVLSKVNKAEKVELSADRLIAGSTKGYRMVRATRGVTDGIWYFEILVEKLGPTGHTRLGWCTQKGDVQAPVGFDSNSYAYRDLDGSKVHMALREPYGEKYEEGDVIGFYINLPNGAELAPKPPPLVSYKGRPYMAEVKEEPPKIVPGSEISFYRNGVCQGVAFKDINAGRYYPAASMYTFPNEPNCTVRFNFGPEFKFPPVDVGALAQAMIYAPFCQLDGQEGESVAWASESHALNSSGTAELQKLGEA